MLGKKIVGKKYEKTYYTHTIFVTKKLGEKTREKFFPENTNSASKKCWKKNCREKMQKRFSYSHEYRDKKMGGKKHAKKFFQKPTNSARKNGKKSSEKSAKYVFYIHTNIVTKKWGKKTRETVF